MSRHQCQACGSLSGRLDGPGLCPGCRSVIPVAEQPAWFMPAILSGIMVTVALAALAVGILIGQFLSP